MKVRRAASIAVSALVISGLSVYLLGAGSERVRSVETAQVSRRPLRQVITGDGRIQAHRSVQVSAETSGKVVSVAVKEGDRVARGQVLVELDPTSAREQVNANRASIELARSKVELARAELRQAESDHLRQVRLHEEALTTDEELQRAQTALEVSRLRLAMESQELGRLQATLRASLHELEKVEIRSEIDGIVTRVNIEEGENAFVGNFNNPATVLLEIADLGSIEARIEVHESDIMEVQPDQSAVVRLDAFDGRSFRGRVTRVGHSPEPGSTGRAETARFEVVVAVDDPIPGVRPGLTCEADVVTATRSDALTVPLQALVRRPGTGPGGEGEEVEGVFVARAGAVSFQPLTEGIADDRYVEVLDGVDDGEQIVVGPFDVLRTLADGERVSPGSSEVAETS